MTKPNLETTKQATINPSNRPANEAFKPSKKPRTNLSALPPEKGGASPRRASAAKGGRAPARPPTRKEGAASGRAKAPVDAGAATSHGDSASAAGGDEASGDDDPATRRATEACFARARPAIEALAPEQIRRINVYVPAAVAIAVGVLPKLRGLRDAMLALPGGADSLDKLEDYAFAALYAHALTLANGEGGTRLRALLREATPLREKLLASAELLARFGHLDAAQVGAIRPGSGYLDTAQDLAALAAIFRASWATIGSKTPVTLAEVERAAELGPLLVTAFGQRQQGTDGSGDPSEAHDRLARAYTLFFNAYDDCRRAVSFLRWREGDADDFAPTLGQSRRRSRSAPADEPGDDGPAPGGEAPGGGPAPGGETPGDAPGGDSGV
ncbi:MAG TPA: hypothetical protein VFS43_10245 [Polyangiaceae bacterium]|nr:hypothetical protein [Polyangiaceae bacterium]